MKFKDYLSKNLDTTIDYSEYLAENLDNTYSQYIAESLYGETEEKRKLR
ncbi:hypothetical protein M0Q50_03810 [bacterium]|jgi:hypothetical protein|nr:hypothetical protein [bacterium]